MDSHSTIQLITIIVLLLLSGFFSSAETAFVTVNRIKLRKLVDENNKKAILVTKILDNQTKMLSAILVGNNIVNISCSALVTTFTIRVWGNFATGIATGILTVFVLIFGEITPKNAATKYCLQLSLLYAPVIRAIMFVFTPVIWIIDNISGFFLRLIGIKDDSADGKITEDELRTIVKVSHEEGVIESDERKIIYNLFDFGDTTAKDVMIPRIDMELVDVNASYEEVLEVFRETQYTRLPVYEKDSDNIIGILNIKDLIITPQNGEFNIRNIMRDVRYTFEQKNTSELFREMQVNSTSIVIVLDEYGSTAGMITTEDLLEEIVGEIRDEYDTDEREGIYKIRGNTYRVDASFKLDDLNDYLNLHLESEDNDSIGGLILEKLDRIPKAGDKLTIDNVWLFIEKASTKRAESIILKLLDTTKNEDSKDNQ